MSLIGNAVTGGCLGRLRSSDGTDENVVGVRINNLFDKPRTVEIEIKPLGETTAGERSYSDSFDIGASSDVQKKNILPAGDYSVTVRVQNGDTKTEKWHMGGSETNKIIIDIGEGGIVVQAARHE
ncbi:hypothetical protein [Haladaptatus sp. DFWS20]|uniref:hypothetical protein n=1 Tax=Haladaptatus sp. DFWS20 TaxID=3403467 RepID=UPI003EB7594D